MSNRSVTAIAAVTVLFLSGCRADSGGATVDSDSAPSTTAAVTAIVDEVGPGDAARRGEPEADQGHEAETSVPGVHGHFSDEELAELERALNEINQMLTDIELDLEAD